MSSHKLRRLVPEAVVVAGTATRVEILLRRHDLPEACRRLGVALELADPSPAAGMPPVLPSWTREPVRWTDRVMRRWPLGDTCLRRCLVLGNRLAGLSPVLRLGTRRGVTGKAVAHAWLEVGGRPLDSDLDGILPLVGPWPAA